MALRNILLEKEELLRKKSKEVIEFDQRLFSLADDMKETLSKHEGLGIAAPQIGVLKRVIVIDTGKNSFVIANPIIIENTGEQVEVEGCLSVPGIWGEVKRPYRVTVEGRDLRGKKIRIKGEDLLARVICHEVDHLDGILFTDKVIKYVDADKKN